MVLNPAKSRAWTEEELKVDPCLQFSIRPTAWAFGPLYFVLDHASCMTEPFIDTVKESPFYNDKEIPS
ncbi:hypothetical protein PP301_gp099 [Gordonia phage GMA2]|uniref:Uncharacterized protein n=1 Tax=Gordonia phage GMA2 TaxID=1647283 RepID=A0A0K0N794_9CAUD|nr:hypothetical protein PP301_gp099 [Gordonia phage GMA2]AKJ72623.1 hypothetical protein GMA2_85 [Gordonia phage GMA2]